MIFSRWGLLTPWWARALLNTAIGAATYTVVAAMLFPSFLTAPAWPWNAAGITALSALSAAAVMYAQQPLYRAYDTALHDLSRQQRAQAVAAVRTDSVPDDPAVLAGAIRVAALGTAYLQRVTRSTKQARWFAIGAYTFSAVVQLWTSGLRHALLWLGFALYFAVYFIVLTRRENQLPPRIERLRAAATGAPQAEAAVAQTAGGVPRPPRRLWVITVLIAVMFTGFLVADHFWSPRPLIGSPPHRGDCDTSGEVFQFIDRHPEMLNAERITGADPGLPAYEDWSHQLRTFASSVTWPQLAPHLNRIADLSGHAVDVVRDLRQHTSATTDVIAAHQTDYQTTVSAIVTEIGKAADACGTTSRDHTHSVASASGTPTLASESHTGRPGGNLGWLL